jgi:hypothetical protein
MPATLIVQRAAQGGRPAPGARPAAGELELGDFDGLFARIGIATGIRESRLGEDARPLYERVLGEAWHRLPEPLQQMHTVRKTLTARGLARVQRGSGMLARLAAWMFGFPQAGEHVPVEVRFEVANGSETWQRNFAGRTFRSYQRAGSGRSDKLICERFGPFEFSLAAVVDQERLRLVPRRWTAFGIPLPRALMPYGDTYEHLEDGRFCFHVEIALPLIGLIVRYQGHLIPCPEGVSPAGKS